jgi:phenylacetate-coenzyme A ligase PaaK-like adenylate-forming protein
MLELQEKWRQFTPKDAEAQELELKETLKRAYTSPLYKKIWKNTDLTSNTLQNLPFLSRAELFDFTKSKPTKVNAAPVSHWFLGNNRAVHEWFPYSEQDFMAIAPNLKRLAQMVGLRKGDIVLALVDTPPRISSFIPYLWSNSEAKEWGLEFIVGSLDWYDTLGMSWINFIQKRRPTAILASTTNAKALADKIEATKKSAKDVLSDLRVGVFLGNQTETDMIKLVEPYSHLEAFEVYSPLEHMAFCVECTNHKGIHVWQDNCIPEIIPTGQKEAQLLTKTQLGVEGELVLTNFSKALPLVRYKTENAVRVEGLGECRCGCNHPKVKFLKK